MIHQMQQRRDRLGERDMLVNTMLILGSRSLLGYTPRLFSPDGLYWQPPRPPFNNMKRFLEANMSFVCQYLILPEAP